MHIYCSMFGLAALLFFSVTGITLNHPSWFLSDAERVTEAEGAVDPDWLVGDDSRSVDDVEEANPVEGVDRLAVVEHLRAEHGVDGALAEFNADEYECMVTFRGPGYSADAFIDRETGRYTLTEVRSGAVAVLNDLHKGRDTGPAWSAVIDLSAALMAFVAITGLVLLFFLKLRRGPGLIVAAIGAVVVVAVVLLLVP